MIKGKKADEKIMSIWMFIIWFAVAFSIVASIAFVYKVEVDIRELQSSAVAERIAECIISKGNLRQDFSSEFDVFKNCNLNKESENLYFKISAKEIIVESGDKDIAMQCEIRTFAEAKEFGKCVRKKIYVLKDGKETEVEIIIGSKNLGDKI